MRAVKVARRIEVVEVVENFICGVEGRTIVSIGSAARKMGRGRKERRTLSESRSR